MTATMRQANSGELRLKVHCSKARSVTIQLSEIVHDYDNATGKDTFVCKNSTSVIFDEFVTCAGSGCGRTLGLSWTSSKQSNQAIHQRQAPYIWATTAIRVLRSFRAMRPNATLNTTNVAPSIFPTSPLRFSWPGAKQLTVAQSGFGCRVGTGGLRPKFPAGSRDRDRDPVGVWSKAH